MLNKIGKKLCFPDVPSTWITRTVDSILHSQDCFKRKPNLAQLNRLYPPRPLHNDYEADECRSCNPLSRVPTDSTFVHTPNPVSRAPSVKDAYLWSFDNERNVYKFMNDCIEENKHSTLNQGEPFDVISLLKTSNDGTHIDHDAYLIRNNGDVVPVEALRGKNIVVYFLFLPCFWLFPTPCSLRGMFTLCAHLNKIATANSEVQTETVVVAKMRRNWGVADDDQDAFNHFFSGFPSSWLTVPFSHTLRRDHICKSIGLIDYPGAILVDSNHKVVTHENILVNNGFYSFPFCDPYDSCLWWKKYIQLDLILGLDSDYVFKMIDYGSNKEVSLSDLKQKVVGLYLCYDGSFIRTLDMVSKECKARNQEFEVVLVYLPYNEGVNPPLFQEAINHVLHNLGISDWWVSPFDDFVSRRLWEATEYSLEDELVILDPHMNIADPFAKYVLDWFGVNSYPFTREFIVRRELEALRAVTLESLLVYGTRDHVLRIDNDNNVEEVRVAQLRGKVVLLYVDNVQKPVPKVYDKLLDWYNRIKKSRFADDFEVIFVSDTPFDNLKLLPVPMPWLVCPFDLQHTTFVSRKTLKSGCYGYLITFGKDGHIINLYSRDLLHKYEPQDFPSYKDFCKEIIDLFHYNYLMDMTGVVDSLQCLKN